MNLWSAAMFQLSPPRSTLEPSRRVALPTVAFLTFLMVGCGGGQGDLSGKVIMTEGGKTRTLAMGSVMVIGRDGRPYYSEIEDDGSYKVTGVPTGEATIVVTSTD